MGGLYKNKLGYNIIFIMILLITTILAGCGTKQKEGMPRQQEQVETREDTTIPHPVKNNPEPEVKSYTTEAKLIAVGDIMMHNTQIAAGYDATTKSYNFDAFFTDVKDILSAGDWVIGNLETPTAGEELKYTGYPLFNAPAEIIDACKNVGFNILTTANNHSLDRGEKGVIRTREQLLAKGMETQGTARSFEEAEKILMISKNEINMAILAYTYGTNGIPVPKGKEYLVSLIDENKIIQDIAHARELGADVVTVSLHFGIEYQLEPNQEQIELVHKLIAAGADIILGSHPHVVQPYQWVEVKDENGIMRKGVAIYSLGNFISAQKGERQNLGLIFSVEVRKSFPEGTIQLESITTIPTWVHSYKKNGKLNYRVLPIRQTIEKQNDPLLTQKDYEKLASYLEKMNAHVQSMEVAVIKQNGDEEIENRP